MTPRGGRCERCGRETGNLARHQKFCKRGVVVEVRVIRAGAHAQPESTLRPDQRFAYGVTEVDVARVLYSLESGVRPYRTIQGRWVAPKGTPLEGMGSHLSASVNEMIRTGLLRHCRTRDGDRLVPARVHLLGADGLSACHFTGETLGPMRSRLESKPDAVDCLACLECAESARDTRT